MRQLSLAVAAAMLLFHTNASAQERGIELQGSDGYVRDSGEGPSVRAVSAGVVAWLTSGWGVGARVTRGLGHDHFDPVEDGGDRVFLGPADLRVWAVTSQWRAFTGRTGVNVAPDLVATDIGTRRFSPGSLAVIPRTAESIRSRRASSGCGRALVLSRLISCSAVTCAYRCT